MCIPKQGNPQQAIASALPQVRGAKPQGQVIEGEVVKQPQQPAMLPPPMPAQAPGGAPALIAENFRKQVATNAGNLGKNTLLGG